MTENINLNVLTDNNTQNQKLTALDMQALRKESYDTLAKLNEIKLLSFCDRIIDQGLIQFVYRDQMLLKIDLISDEVDNANNRQKLLNEIEKNINATEDLNLRVDLLKYHNTFKTSERYITNPSFVRDIPNRLKERSFHSVKVEPTEITVDLY